jgi:hypothetical protein
LVNGRLEGNPTSEVWREVAEFHLEDGEAEDYYTRRSSKAQRLSGIQRHLVMGLAIVPKVGIARLSHAQIW